MARLTAALLWMLLPLAAQSLRFAAIGDSGTGDARQARVARQMETHYEKSRWEFVLMLGDNIYEKGDPRDFDRKFKNVYRKLMSGGLRFHAALGNHDRQHPLSRKGLAQVEDDAFGYLGRQDEYVLVAGPPVQGRPLARFIALNSEAWLEEMKQPSLVAVRLARLRKWLAQSGDFHWNFAFFHSPLYSFVTSRFQLFNVLAGGYGHGPEIDLRRLIEPEFKGRIDAVFSGHEHFYQKIRPQQGIHYFISGGAAKIRKGAMKNHPEVEFAAEVLHFMDLELNEKQLRYSAISDQGSTIHSGTIPAARRTPTE